jgi:phosphohistidine phosphatase SixA
VLLYLVRHAEAAPGEPDELRALTPAGREVARALGEQLAGERLDAVLTSPLLRARETAEAIAKASGLEAEADERLAPGATVDDVRAAVAGRGERVAVVGHQPDCSLIATAVSGVDPGFPAGGVARLDLGA